MALVAKNDRACSRTPVELDVTLVSGFGIPFHGILTNISFSGGFIEANNKRLQPDSPLTIVLQQSEGNVNRVYRMSATVVRQDKRGAGVMFDDFDHDTVRTLRTIYKSTLSH